MCIAGLASESELLPVGLMGQQWRKRHSPHQSLHTRYQGVCESAQATTISHTAAAVESLP